MSNVQDTDIVVVGRGVNTYQATFEDFKSSVIADDGVGKGDIRVVVGNGLTSSGDHTHNANQQINTQQNLKIKTGLGITFDSNGGVIIDPSFNLDGNITPPGNGALNIINSDGSSQGIFSANQDQPMTLQLPVGFPEAPGDGSLYVRDGQTESWVRGLPYDFTTLPDLP